LIRSEAEYQEALRRAKQDRELAHQQREALLKERMSPEEVERAMQPLLSFQAQLIDEIAWYERVRRGDIPTIRRLTHLGRQLIALRIASGMTQRELAEALGVSEPIVSRDERNEYHGITIERAQRILDVIHASLEIRMAPANDREPVEAR
jgi:transcriptional regulator with XRE-family HTH domain